MNGFPTQRVLTERERVRLEVYRRDGNVCQYCACICVTSLAERTKLIKKKIPAHLRRIRTLDHVLPESKGGEFTAENLVVACRPCNGKKGGKTLDESGMTLIIRNFLEGDI